MTEQFRGRRALVTGASSGIGADIARQLAQRGADLVLVARRADRLETLATECRLFGVDVETAPADLADPQASSALAARFPETDILINNAGLGAFGRFTETEYDKIERMIAVNITSLTHLTRLFAPAMAARGWGRIMLVASTAGFQPVPLYAVYAATKAYVLSFGGALNVELAPSGVTTTVLCPGTTRTEFFEVAAQTKSPLIERNAMGSADVARIGLDALAKGRATVISGAVNNAMAFGTRFAPRSLTAQLAYRIMKP
ncbi:MAG: oxidoreductase [Acidiphilium sp. 37-64-53]|uniref:SDR family NAD(P)-dependent oxidoreductase n=1 Tax=Acidiphilium TaxID=522 RepID=UPI000BC99EF1|nr:MULTISPECIES: SDR family oxidoreductase [Acidiphilium]OYW04071.1 MAG: oxidoreductase [Acidiphilium sp. 37-64-53]OZB29006.1 MAG: oxidoreductase [Acidiphilium sp. 34-64-41]HQT83306.1 SDR family oxidoreductase [Acidiphilium rubrum]